MILVVKRIASLIIKQWKDELDYAGQQELDQWAGESPANAQLLEQLSQDEGLRRQLLDYYEAEESKDIIWKKIDSATTETTTVVAITSTRSRWSFKYAIAAVTIAALVTAGAYMVLQKSGKPVVPAVAQRTLEQVLPGGNKAVLTLHDGKQIILDDAANGTLATEGSTIVSKKKDGEIEYKSTGNSPLAFNTLATPKGGQFQLVLPDGSKVWLNAASSITYPTAFTGNERRVEITGEAYFEVAKSANKPFKVHFESSHREGEVEVLGTHFNINAYDDENAVKTTLIEGRVRVHSGTVTTILKPSEQTSISQSSHLTNPIPVQTEDVIAWTNGEFAFKGADIETILKQAARWYDLEISYPHGKPTDTYRGRIPRNANLSQFLTILQTSEVKCKLDGNTLIVYQ
jgi:transmembrane sensor